MPKAGYVYETHISNICIDVLVPMLHRLALVHTTKMVLPASGPHARAWRVHAPSCIMRAGGASNNSAGGPFVAGRPHAHPVQVF